MSKNKQKKIPVVVSDEHESLELPHEKACEPVRISWTAWFAGEVGNRRLKPIDEKGILSILSKLTNEPNPAAGSWELGIMRVAADLYHGRIHPA